MFYYRPWARLPGTVIGGGRGGAGGGGAGGRYDYQDYPDYGDDYAYDDPINDVHNQQFYFHRWGFAALLLVTLLAAAALNISFLLSFVGSAAVRRAPHWPLLALSLRDLLVALAVIPIAVDWMVVNVAEWGGGSVACSVAGFLDFTLAAAYPLTLIVLAVTLYTRNYFPPEEDVFDDLDLPLDPLSGMPPVHTSSRAPSVANSYRPPSVVGSDAGYRNGHRQQQRFSSSPAGASMNTTQPQPMGRGGARQPFHVVPNRPGSVTGSIEGRLAGTRGNISGVGRMQQLRAGGHNFRASSPLREADEMGSDVGDASDLWDAASLDYPGRDSPGGGVDKRQLAGGAGSRAGHHHGEGWEFMDQPEGEVEYTWQTWLLVFLLVALGFGVPATMNMVNVPRSRPGCMIPVDPFSNPYSPTIEDFGFNFLMVFVIVCLFVPIFIITLILSLICYHRRANRHFGTWIKVLVSLSIVFVLSRCPMDIVSFTWLMEAASGVTLRDHMDIEIEIVLMWVAFLPTVFNPIIYYCYLGEHRRGLKAIATRVCPCDKSGNRRVEKEAPAPDGDEGPSDLVIKETQESDIL